MITLTNPISVESIIGGNLPVPYDKLIVNDFIFHVHPSNNRKIDGSIIIRSTSVPEMPEIKGGFIIDLSLSTLEVSIVSRGFSRKITLTAPQITFVSGLINTSQNSIEQGLINVNVVAGVQSTGV